MLKRAILTGLISLLLILVWAPAGHPVEVGGPIKDTGRGLFEVDCNMAGIHLTLCPAENFRREETRAFFGIIKSSRNVCSGGEFSLGATPVRPAPVPHGDYILLIPPEYVWEKKGPIRITIRSGEKTYFLLKLFSTGTRSPAQGYGCRWRRA
ncbi:MAG TPA: hypothetical protein ENH37_03205 [Deltaproteobacteria bacterium]|nr:hypothetical protein [Deltaproteobacteria bacterium]